jgi:hypothetical protein
LKQTLASAPSPSIVANSSEPFAHDRASLSKVRIMSVVRIMIRLALALLKQMFKKDKMQFIEFYGLFRYFDRKSAGEIRT